MSRLTTCGSWEGHYILDFLQEDKSEVQPDTIHADTQGQSTAIFGLAYLLGIELMPRIRNWKDQHLFRPAPDASYKHIDEQHLLLVAGGAKPAQLLKHGLVRPSFVPPKPFRETAGPDPLSQGGDRRTGTRVTAIAQGARGRRHQTVVGRVACLSIIRNSSLDGPVAFPSRDLTKQACVEPPLCRENHLQPTERFERLCALRPDRSSCSSPFPDGTAPLGY